MLHVSIRTALSLCIGSLCCFNQVQVKAQSQIEFQQTVRFKQQAVEDQRFYCR